MSFASRTSNSSQGSNNATPKSRRAIPIIDPANMAPVSVPNQQFMVKTSPIFGQQNQYWNHGSRSPMNGSYYDVLVQ